MRSGDSDLGVRARRVLSVGDISLLALHERQARVWNRRMIGYYAVVSCLAIALLFVLCAMVSQPAAVAAERSNTQVAESKVSAQATEIAQLQSRLPPTPISRYGSGYP